MADFDLRTLRKKLSWNQQQLAHRMGVSQGLVSLWERGVRTIPENRVVQLQRLGVNLNPLSLPIREARMRGDYSQELANLGYPGFEHLRTGQPRWNPAQLLVSALSEQFLDRRIAEALPWLVLRYWKMDWDWVRREAKLRDLQNRLGFTLALAQKLATVTRNDQAAVLLEEQQKKLRGSLLAKEDTLCNDRLTDAERKWLRKNRSPEAAAWHVLSDLRTDHLVHA